MKAVTYKQYGSPNVLNIDEIEKPKPGEYDVLIKIHSSTITTVDSIFRQAKNFFARIATGVFRPKNQILGTEFSGVVEETGGKVTRFKVGDKVFGASDDKMAVHAEYKSINENEAIIHKPDNLSFEKASALPAGALTALPFLRDTGKIKKGDKILIIGASGSVGTYAVQFAKYFGAHVTGVCSTANVDLVKSLGADEVIDYTKEDYTNRVKSYNIIFDTVGVTSFSKVINSLTTKGVFLTTFVSFTILRQMLTTSFIGNRKAKIAFTGLRPAKDKIEDLQIIKNLASDRRLEVIIDRTYQLDNAVYAHAYVDKGHKRGNVILVVNNFS